MFAHQDKAICEKDIGIRICQSNELQLTLFQPIFCIRIRWNNNTTKAFRLTFSDVEAFFHLPRRGGYGYPSGNSDGKVLPDDLILRHKSAEDNSGWAWFHYSVDEPANRGHSVLVWIHGIVLRTTRLENSMFLLVILSKLK